MSNQYQFLSRWRVEGTCGEVADILGDPLALPRWWPSVYLDVEELRAARRAWARPPHAPAHQRLPAVHARLGLRGHRDALSVRVHARRERRLRRPRRVDLRAGRHASSTSTYDWRLTAEKPLLRNLSFLLKPVFEANHRWAMAQGERSLKLELSRRRATSDAARALVPPPPGPVTYAGRGAGRRRGRRRRRAGVSDAALAAAAAGLRAHVEVERRAAWRPLAGLTAFVKDFGGPPNVSYRWKACATTGRRSF